jgi:hypothetical protein
LMMRLHSAGTAGKFRDPTRRTKRAHRALAHTAPSVARQIHAVQHASRVTSPRAMRSERGRPINL